jgi:hypothetical protein
VSTPAGSIVVYSLRKAAESPRGAFLTCSARTFVLDLLTLLVDRSYPGVRPGSATVKPT